MPSVGALLAVAADEPPEHELDQEDDAEDHGDGRGGFFDRLPSGHREGFRHLHRENPVRTGDRTEQRRYDAPECVVRKEAILEVLLGSALSAPLLAAFLRLLVVVAVVVLLAALLLRRLVNRGELLRLRVPVAHPGVGALLHEGGRRRERRQRREDEVIIRGPARQPLHTTRSNRFNSHGYPAPNAQNEEGEHLRQELRRRNSLPNRSLVTASPYGRATRAL